jgi:hypothetical protein
MKKLGYVLMVLVLSSCVEEYEPEYITISGKLVDDSQDTSRLSGETAYIRQLVGSGDREIGKTIINDSGEFTFTYLADSKINGTHLRIAFSKSFIADTKFEFLPIRENWFKEFNISDSANLIIKTTKNLRITDTLQVSTNIGEFIFVGPTLNNKVGMLKLLNTRTDIYYKLNGSDYISTYYTPTGDPIVDTITLTINP